MCKRRGDEMKTEEEVDGFVAYIKETLLPDLEAGGSIYMAADWREAIEIIKQLQNEVRNESGNDTQRR